MFAEYDGNLCREMLGLRVEIIVTRLALKIVRGLDISSQAENARVNILHPIPKASLTAYDLMQLGLALRTAVCISR